MHEKKIDEKRNFITPKKFRGFQIVRKLFSAGLLRVSFYQPIIRYHLRPNTDWGTHVPVCKCNLLLSKIINWAHHNSLIRCVIWSLKMLRRLLNILWKTQKILKTYHSLQYWTITDTTLYISYVDDFTAWSWYIRQCSSYSASLF